MAAIPSAFASVVQAKVDARLASVSGHHPLQQKNPRYFIEFCNAIGQGIIQGGPSIAYTTVDTGLSGLPLVPGIGAGIGIITDPEWMIQDLYTRIRNYVVDDFGRTLHEPYPPGNKNSGQYLLALCEGINDAILSYYPTAWILASVHPLIYKGTGIINDGMFSGLVPSQIQSTIQELAPNFIGKFWPRICQAISESYTLLIIQHATGTVTITGACVPDLTQVCAIPSVGAGTGAAT